MKTKVHISQVAKRNCCDGIPWQSVLRSTPIRVTSTRHLKAVGCLLRSLPSLPFPLSSKPIQQLGHFGALKIFRFSHQPGPRSGKTLPGKTGGAVWAPRHCPNDFANVTHIKSGSWPGKNETSVAVKKSMKRWSRGRNGSQSQKSWHLESKNPCTVPTSNITSTPATKLSFWVKLSASDFPESNRDALSAGPADS